MSGDIMTFPNTWEEYEEQYGFNDTEQVYTNGSRLIPSFRVKQWLEHIDAPHTETMIVHGEEIEVDPMSYEIGYTNGQMAEKVHGKWIIDRAFGNGVMSGEQMVICSECGKGIFWGKQRYCPNCGAKMNIERTE